MADLFAVSPGAWSWFFGHFSIPRMIYSLLKLDFFLDLITVGYRNLVRDLLCLMIRDETMLDRHLSRMQF